MWNFTLFAGIWVALAIVTVGLALYRRVVSADEKDIVRLAEGEEGYIPQQEALAARLNLIDKWGKSLTVVTALLGIVLVSVNLFQVWVDSGTKVHFN